MNLYYADGLEHRSIPMDFNRPNTIGRRTRTRLLQCYLKTPSHPSQTLQGSSSLSGIFNLGELSVLPWLLLVKESYVTDSMLPDIHLIYGFATS